MDRHRNNEKIKLFNREGLLKLLMLLAVAAVVVYFFPAPGKFRYEYAVGKPWEYSLLTAPFDIPIELDEAQKAAKRDSVDQAFVRVYSHNIRIADDQARRLNEKLATTSLPINYALLSERRSDRCTPTASSITPHSTSFSRAKRP